MDRTNDDQTFESTDLLDLAKKFESPDIDIRQLAVLELGSIAMKAIQTESGSKRLANLLLPKPDDESPEITNVWLLGYEQALDRLVDEKKKLDVLLQTAKAGYWQWDIKTGEKTFDASFYAMAGYTPEHIEKFRNAIDLLLIHPDDIEQSNNLLQACINGETDNFTNKLRMRHSNGNWFMAMESAKVSRIDNEGKAVCILGTTVNIDEGEKAIEQNKKWAKMFINTEWAIAIGSLENGNIQMANMSLIDMYGYSQNEINKLSFIDLFSPEHRSQILKSISINEPAIHINTESVHTRKDGSEFTALADIHVEKDKHNKIIYSSITVIDITHIKELEKKLLEMALTDKLTGLYSRHHLDEQSEILQKSNRQYPISIINIDIDGLKIINDTYGHTAGDKLLKKMGAVIKNVFRQEDCVCRAGGDEFVILLPGIDEASALEKIDLIMASLAHFNQIDSDHILSLSIGTATVNNYTKDYEKNWDTAYQAADQRMRDNKKAKKNGVITP